MTVLHFGEDSSNYSTHVAKFGGSHFKSREGYDSAAEYIDSCFDDGKRIVPFVSAPYDMTDRLDDLFRSRGEQETFEIKLDDILTDYESFLQENPEADVIKEELEDFRERREDLSLAEVKGSGEYQSAHILKGVLEREGIPADAISGYEAGFYLDESGRLDLEGSRGKIRQSVESSLDEGRIPVIGGYQGRLLTDPSQYALGGRGSSDLFAAAGAAAVNADKLEIIKNNEGICPVDPGLWSCRPLEKMSYDEMVKLSWRGNPVIYPTAVSMARDNEVPILVKNIDGSDFEGTLVSEESQTSEKEPYIGISYNTAQMITVKDSAFGAEEGSSYLSDLSEAIEDIRLISSDPEEISFTLLENSSEPIGSIDEEIERHLREKGYSPQVTQEPVSMVSICGDSMKERVGTFAEIVQSIAESNASIIMGGQTNEKQSSPSISFCVAPEKGEDVVKQLAEEYFQDFKPED